MAVTLAPLSQTVILTEDGVPVSATKQVTIPPFVASLLTVFEGGRNFQTLRPSDVPGLWEAIQAIDADLKAKGR